VEFDIDFITDENSRSRAEVLEDIRLKVRTIPGTFSVVSGPLADRIGHMLSGVSAKIAIKVFGPSLDEIRRVGTDIQTVAHSIPGLETARIEQQAPIPQLRIEVDRERALAYGVTPGALNSQLSALMAGDTVGQLYEGQRTVELVVRLPESWREQPDRLRDLYINTLSGQRIPLHLIAKIRNAKGPNVIQRENTQRRFVVSINPTVRDLAGLVRRLQAKVSEKVAQPKNVFISYEGEFQAQQEATKRIAWMSIAVFVIIALLLFNYFKTAVFAVQILADIPLALVGGIVFTWLTLKNISIATLVGFIAVAGISARNSVMLLSHYLHLMRHEGEGFTREMIERGTLERLAPVFMTALSAGIALIPLVLAAEQPGKEILHPVAVVIVGGLVTSTFLGLGVTPAVFYTFGRKAAQRSIDQKAAASD
jgi:Cu/Ag efflux pump CusA